MTLGETERAARLEAGGAAPGIGLVSVIVTPPQRLR
jgi:hypothetical protein